MSEIIEMNVLNLNHMSRTRKCDKIISNGTFALGSLDGSQVYTAMGFDADTLYDGIKWYQMVCFNSRYDRDELGENTTSLFQYVLWN